MKILQIHNRYLLSGGEDVVVENEKRLLESKGHSVFQFIKDNKEINNYSLLKKANLINSSVWSNESFMGLKELIQKVKPDICHVHNYMPLISPAVFYACKEMGVPVVQTLHNYRMLCANGYLFRNGNVCEECVGRSLYRGVKYACFRNSRIQTFTVAKMIETHKRRGTFTEFVDAFICLSEFAKAKFIEGGMLRDKIFIKPNFLFGDPGFSEKDEGYFFFAGRLDEIKGVNILIEAVHELTSVKFKVAGEGPSKEKVTAVSNIEYLGQLRRNELIRYLKNSTALVFPSISYETFGLSIIESFACSKPVIGSKLGAMAEIIEDSKTGLLFEPGNAKALADKIKWAIENKDEMKQMGKNARNEYEEKYTADRNYEILMEIYYNLRESVRIRG